MLASEYNPKVQRGGTFSVGIVAKDENDVPMDFSVYDSMLMVVRPAWVGKPGTIKEEPLLTLSTATGEIVVDDSSGQWGITITMTAAVTAALEFNSGRYELEMVIDEVDENTPEVIDKLLYGIMYITGEITI